MNLAQLKELCAAKVREARLLKKQQRKLIDEAGKAATRLLCNKRLRMGDGKEAYLPPSLINEVVFCRGFNPHKLRQEISVEVSPYRVDGSIGARIFDVPIEAIDEIVD